MKYRDFTKPKAAEMFAAARHAEGYRVLIMTMRHDFHEVRFWK